MTDLLDWHKWLDQVKFFMSEKVPIVGDSQVTEDGALSLSTEISVNPVCAKKSFDDRPYLNVRISDCSFLALIDTGSSISILGFDGLQILKYVDLCLTEDSSFHVTTADGNLQSVSGYFWAPITLGNVTRLLKILVIPS